jgi:predicted TIM-barrel fold metal-dependent hydrolase
VRTHDNLAISDADKKKLMQTNAERVFNLGRR